MVEVQYTICHWATNRSDPQNLLSTTLDVLLQVWDHAIDLKETFKLQKRRIYPLSKNDRKVQNFVEDQLRKGYIRPSKSPQTSPVFFVGKKDGSKQMVMDYCNLNDQTMKNNYPLPLITELINKMDSKKVFTKIDLR